MVDIVNVKDFIGGIDKAVDYIHGVWGNESNRAYYEDSITNGSKDEKRLPRFYLLLNGEEIIGCSGLITNDFISRHDLYPWLSSLYIEEAYRGNAYARLLMAYVIKDAKALGFNTVYLTTNHHHYYEKFGWKRIEDGIDLFTGKHTRIYMKGVEHD
jgi:GNAT superfamily N-acetyltransferase